jgi:hypothetical protein
VTFKILPHQDLTFAGVDRRMVLESGNFLFGIGHEVDCRANPGQCAKFTLGLSSRYSPPCAAACEAWEGLSTACDAGAMGARRMGEREECVGMCRGQGGWGWNYVECVEGALAEGVCAVHTLCRDVFAK